MNYMILCARASPAPAADRHEDGDNRAIQRAA
eukprot:COSAG02_NODE_56654_length_284_cov_1.102703_1_plen_31_part_10